MENCVYHRSSRLFNNLSRKPGLGVGFNIRRRPMNVKASVGPSHCEFSSLNSPLEPKSDVGKALSGVLQNHREMFHVAVAEELKLLVDDRDAALGRMALSTRSHEASLHRRIAEIKEHECEIAVQDVMYLLIFEKFNEMRVPLVPKLCRCMYNGRLEILPSKHWELESIYSIEILDMIREHVTSVTGLRPKSSVTETWATTEIRQFLLPRIYVASILYGYFLKSLSLRQHLERSLCVDVPHPGLAFHKHVKCAKLRSKEAVNLVQTYSFALFGNEESSSIQSDDVILTSFSSLKRRRRRGPRWISANLGGHSGVFPAFLEVDNGSNEFYDHQII